jgi:hypothetical protein
MAWEGTINDTAAGTAGRWRERNRMPSPVGVFFLNMGDNWIVKYREREKL